MYSWESTLAVIHPVTTQTSLWMTDTRQFNLNLISPPMRSLIRITCSSAEHAHWCRSWWSSFRADTFAPEFFSRLHTIVVSADVLIPPHSWISSNEIYFQGFVEKQIFVTDRQVSVVRQTVRLLWSFSVSPVGTGVLGVSWHFLWIFSQVTVIHLLFYTYISCDEFKYIFVS